MIFDFHVPTRVIFGRGRLDDIGVHAGEWGERALIVCGRSAMRASGVLHRVNASLAAAGIKSQIYDQVSANPRSDEVDAAVVQAVKFDAQMVIGLGGGSALDAAKAVAVSMAHGPAAGLVGQTLAPSPASLPVIAVPTTAGSGAEVTKGAIITDVVRGIKSGIRGEDLFPQLALVDPSLTETLPLNVAIDSGFDAFAHAFEGFVARRSSPVNKGISEQAIRTLAPALKRLATGDTTPEVQDALSLGALLGGINVATASTCLPHRMQQAMGTAELVGPTHGAGLALLYPAWLEAIEPVATDELVDIAGFLGASDARTAVCALLDTLRLSSSLSSYGYRPEDVTGFADRISGNLDNDPHPSPGRELIHSIYRHSL